MGEDCAQSPSGFKVLPEGSERTVNTRVKTLGVNISHFLKLPGSSTGISTHIPDPSPRVLFLFQNITVFGTGVWSCGYRKLRKF